MIDKILTLKNGIQYCVLDEINENSKKYIIAFQVDEDTEAVTGNFVIGEVISGLNNDSTLTAINDNDTYLRIANIFTRRLSE